MSGKPDPSQAARPPRRRALSPTLLACAGLFSVGLCAGGQLRSLQAARGGQTAALLHGLSRQSLWLHGAAGSRPRKEWQAADAAMDADWARLTAASPAAAKALGDRRHTLDKSLQAQGRLGRATADRFSQAADDQAVFAAREADRQTALANRLTSAGAAGLFLCLLGSLALGRRQRLTQFQTTQEYLAAERTNWEKQRGAFDAQRDQLITELQQAQQHKTELDTLRRHGSRQFEEFFRTLPVACFCVDSAGKIVRWNGACETLYGYAAGDILDRPLWETIVPSDERERVAAQFAHVLSGESLAEVERHDRHADGSPRKVRCSLAPLRDAAGQIIGCLSANLALAEAKTQDPQNEALQEALRQMQSRLDAQQRQIDAPPPVAPEGAPAGEAVAAPTQPRKRRDPVTGLHTHGDFQEHVRREFERMARYNTAPSLVLIDLDHFGRYNETFGYPAGDQALRDIAEMLNTKVRSVDTVARYGADELAILLPETGRAGALIAAERFRAGIAGIAWDGKPLTASLGVAVLTPDVPQPKDFIAKALAALRDSSGSGPNRLVCADQGTE